MKVNTGTLVEVFCYQMRLIVRNEPIKISFCVEHPLQSMTFKNDV